MKRWWTILLLVYIVSLQRGLAAENLDSLTDRSWTWPAKEHVLRVFTLRDYNTRVVMIGTMFLGLAGGMIGTFMLLRRRSLMADAVSHATLPGIALAFIVMTTVGMSGKSLPGLLLGGLISGLVGMGAVMLIKSQSRLKEDTALGIVLSVFFGLGIALLGVIQKMKSGHAAGLESFIYGKAASMLAGDAWLTALAAFVISLICIVFYKEFSLLCFDQDYAKTQGWPTHALDALMMGLVVAVTVIGLQAVGLILVIALLIVPPAAARFWSHRLKIMLIVSAIFGAVSCLVGATLSALFPKLPTGAIIVVAMTFLFIVSMIFAPARGVFFRWFEYRRLTLKIARQHLLRAMFEYFEKIEPHLSEDAMAVPEGSISWKELLEERSWSPRFLKKTVRSAARSGLLQQVRVNQFSLTAQGLVEARRVVLNHRLWEIYLIEYADVAPSHVDRDADQIEHVLGADMLKELHELLAAETAQRAIPVSPHHIEFSQGASS